MVDNINSNNNNNTYYIQRLIKLYFNGKLKTKYKIELSRSMQTYSAQAIDYSKKGASTGKTNNINHEIDNYMSAKCEAEQRTSFLRLLIDEIEEALEVLISKNELTDGHYEIRKEDYYLLKWSYQRVPKYSDEEVAEKLGIHRNTLISKRNSIFEELSKLINVDFYINNPITDIADFFDNFIDG